MTSVVCIDHTGNLNLIGVDWMEKKKLFRCEKCTNRLVDTCEEPWCGSSWSLTSLSPQAGSWFGYSANLVVGDMPAKPPCTNILIKDYFSLSFSNFFFGGISFLLPPFIGMWLPFH